MSQDDNDLTIEYGENGIFYFDPALALGYLLSKGLFVLNTHWVKIDWPIEAQNTMRFVVICNDLFDQGADGVSLDRDDIELLYRLYTDNNRYGVDAWCVHKRRAYPQNKTRDRLLNAGYDFERLINGSNEELLEIYRQGPTKIIL